MPNEKTEPTKNELVERAQIVRAFEASCSIEHPSETERAFREALMKKLALGWNLKELKLATINPPTGR